MDHSSIVEQHPAPPTAQFASSARVASRLRADDGGRSLAAIAYRDLDAALQLLAERAQYITGASGAMIALRRGEHNDMLCRASAGSNAPELGALFSMEYGFSGESVRTRQALRCDDAERDPRVNREGCKHLGIASVMVVPVLSDQQVLGVFELFSGRPHAFGERDLSALQRLGEMVETAVKYAVAAQTVSTIQDPSVIEEVQPPLTSIKIEVETNDDILETDDLLTASPSPPSSEAEKIEAAEDLLLSTSEALTTQPEKAELKAAAEPALKKPLFWSSAMQTASAPEPASSVPTAVPAVLRNLHKCRACGFPVSHGRTFCVECEEKQWRGQRLPQNPAGPVAQPQPNDRNTTKPPSTASGLKNASLTQLGEVQAAVTVAVNPAKPLVRVSDSPSRDLPSLQNVAQNKSADIPDNSALFLSSVVQPESWFAANKYVLGALMVVAIVAAVLFLR
jgi:hypothetical protein